MDFEQTVRHNATYWSEDGEGTAGYLLSEEQFAAILAAHHKALEQAEQAARVDELERLGGYRPNGIADDQMLMGIDINERLAQLTESNNCPRCQGTGKNSDASVLGYPGKPCYYCGGTGIRPNMSAVQPSAESKSNDRRAE